MSRRAPRSRSRGSPTASKWSGDLIDLAHRLDTGRIYDRDLTALDAPVAALLDALLRRPKAASTRSW